MNKRVIIAAIIIVVIIALIILNPLEKVILYLFRINLPISQKDKKGRAFYIAVYGRRNEVIKKLIEEGADPNYCFGESGWSDSNPLNVVSAGFYNTYYRRKRGDTISNPAPDVESLNILVDAGADINKRPYIWNRVNLYNYEVFKGNSYRSSSRYLEWSFGIIT